ncbi:transcription antitermination factor NusB [Aerococcus urinae]|uniref:transcription antitermination factor NusB n=1 Tax=Aerococcus urinae TaxID=1376 RepID=UPI00254F53CC|nr:transcription antitermination factor NusB [Aerococcus urinae]MDK6371788.1 transcription antitermination factor NusB [Aerococcus urinae]
MNLGLSQIRELAVLTLYQEAMVPESTKEESFAYLLANLDDLEDQLSYEEIDEEQLDQLKSQGLPLEKSQGEMKGNKRFKQTTVSEDEELSLPPYYQELLDGIASHQESIDHSIEDHIQGKWSLKRLEAMNLAILRVGAYEILYGDHDRVPGVVAVDEAIHLARRYSDEASRRFINGVLSSILATAEDKQSEEDL